MKNYKINIRLFFVYILILFSFILSPVIVNANIICNDGTESRSCLDCHRGCCSGHDGCTDNPNSYNYSDESYDDKNEYNSNESNIVYDETDEVSIIKDKEVKDFYLKSSIATSVGTFFIYLCALLLKKGGDTK